MAERVLILMPTTTYRLDAFLEAARRLGVEVVLASDRCPRIAAEHPEAELGAVPVRLDDEEGAVRAIVAAARERPVRAVVATDDATVAIAARAATELGLPANPVEAVRAARNKLRFREALARAGLPHPRFRAFPIDESPRAAAREAAAAVGFPAVVKPLALSASQGVIRADGEEAFAAAFERVARLLRTPEIAARRDPALSWVLAEEFVPGPELALEGLLRAGELSVLALFDKPDPLDGPFFEETIYVTPSRLPRERQEEIARATRAALAAVGLREGPVHAEVRLSPRGAVAIEVAARSIGGLCSRTLRFGTGRSLEEVILLHALGRPAAALSRERRAAGVMMIPIPRAGILRAVRGVKEARAVPLVEEVSIAIEPGGELCPLPEGGTYLGFIFARGDRPEDVEAALRAAHARLRFEVSTALPALDARRPRLP